MAAPSVVATGLPWGDVNADGFADIAFNGNNCDRVNGQTVVGIRLAKGDGTFQDETCYVTGQYSVEAVAIADVNGDGKPDIVTAGDCVLDCSTGYVAVLLGNGDGTFQPAIVSPVIGGGYTLSLGDVNGDGRLDAIVWGNSVGQVLALLGNGDGSFQPAVGYNPPYVAGDTSSNMGAGILSQILLADINLDGHLDIVMLSACASGQDCSGGAVGYLLGYGDGTFQSATASNQLNTNAARTNAYLSSGMAIADLNDDGFPDVAVVSTGPAFSDGVMSVLLGGPLGGFSNAVLYDSGGVLPHSIIAMDVDGDGHPDVIAQNSELCTFCPYLSYIAVFFGDGTGAFPTPPQIYDSGVNDGGPLLSADFNGDGIRDLFVNGNPSFVQLGTAGQLVATTTATTSGLNPSAIGQAVTFTTAVTSKYPSPTVGTVTFYDGPTQLGSAQLTNSSATLTTSTLGNGVHSITASYGGSPNYLASTSPVLSQTVTGQYSTTTSVVSSANPSDINKAVTYTASVANTSGLAVTGSITFKDGAAKLATIAVGAGNTATYSTSYTKTGTHSITATYSGDSNNIGSTSPVLTESITGVGVLTASTTTITTSGSPSFINQPVTLTAHVTWKYGTVPDGEVVTFLDGTATLGTATTTGGTATFSTSSLSVRTHTIKASYPGDSAFKASSATLTQVVSLYTSTTTLTSSPNPSKFGQAVTLTAQVSTNGSVTPTGTVTFKSGTTTLGTATVGSSGSAALSTTKLPRGADSLTASYNGDSLNGKSTSAAVIQTVN